MYEIFFLNIDLDFVGYYRQNLYRFSSVGKTFRNACLQGNCYMLKSNKHFRHRHRETEHLEYK